MSDKQVQDRLTNTLISLKKAELSTYILKDKDYLHFFRNNSSFFVLARVSCLFKGLAESTTYKYSTSKDWMIFLVRQDLVNGLKNLETSPSIFCNNVLSTLRIIKGNLLGLPPVPKFQFKNLGKEFLVLNFKYTESLNELIHQDYLGKHSKLEILENSKPIFTIDITKLKASPSATHYKDSNQFYFKFTSSPENLKSLQRHSPWFNSAIIKIEDDPYYDMANTYSEVYLRLPREDYGFNWIMNDYE